MRIEADGTVVVHKWTTDVRFNDCKDMAKVCTDGDMEDEDMPQRTRQVIEELWNQGTTK